MTHSPLSLLMKMLSYIETINESYEKKKGNKIFSSLCSFHKKERIKEKFRYSIHNRIK